MGVYSAQAVLLTRPVQVPKTSLFLAITVAAATATAAAKTTKKKYSTNYFSYRKMFKRIGRRKLKKCLQPQHKVRMPVGAGVKRTTHHRTLA